MLHYHNLKLPTIQVIDAGLLETRDANLSFLDATLAVTHPIPVVELPTLPDRWWEGEEPPVQLRPILRVSTPFNSRILTELCE